MRHESSLGWLGMSMMWNSEGVPPITFLPIGGERDVQLYLDTFTGLPKSGCRSCGSTDHLSDTCPLSPRRSRDALTQSDMCYNFNKGRPCAHIPCPYQLRCNQPGCSAAQSGEEHAKLTRHREETPKSSSGSGNSSRGHS